MIWVSFVISKIVNRLSRDDHKKQKELEELRKTGAAPPELDEDGKMINPHIPQYISAAPWYGIA
jgi:pre-mRNA-processing factor SLU7